MRRPLLLVSDGPNEPTGLGRIARDLGRLIQSQFADEVELLHVGGPTLPFWREYPHVPMPEADRGEDWGAANVQAIYREWFGDRPGILFVAWDPGRLYPYLNLDLPVDRWAYTAIDGSNVQGKIGGPAAAAVQGFDRVLAYGRWASEVLKPLRPAAVPYLPHGIQVAEWQYAQDDPEAQLDAISSWIGPRWKPRSQRLIGCVATNQPRKDLGLYCHALRVLLDRGHSVFGWVHTDTLVKAWSIPQLIDDFGLQRHLAISTGVLTEGHLAQAYQVSTVTVAPGLGEGFGYPIVESLAAGTPVVHVDTAGGRELVPKREWRFPVREMRVEGIYGIRRPVCRGEDVANAIERVWEWQAKAGFEVAREYCRGAVAHLEWTSLTGRWTGWIRQGLTS